MKIVKPLRLFSISFLLIASFYAISSYNIIQINTESGLQPIYDALAPVPSSNNYFDRYVVSDDFSSNPFGTGEFQWTRTDQTATIEYDSNAMHISASGSGSKSFAIQWNKDIHEENLFDAQINITWEMTEGWLGGSAGIHLDYKIGDGSWTEISSTIKTATFSETTNHYNLDELDLDGTESSVLIRFSGEIQNGVGGSDIFIYGFELGTYKSTITDTPLIDLDQDLEIQYDIQRCGSDSGLTTSLSDYTLYYGVNDPTITAADASATTTGSFNGDIGDLLFTVDSSSYFQDCTVYYAIAITDSDANVYWSSTYSVSVIDGIDPTFSSSISLSDTNETLQDGEDFTFSGNVGDSGGSGLSNVILYWSTSSAVSSGNYLGSDTDNVPSGPASSYSVQIPENQIDGFTTLYARLYVYDNSGNVEISDLITIHPDFIAPIITAIDVADIGYNSSKTLGFSISDLGQGLDLSKIMCNFSLTNDPAGAVNTTLVSHVGDVWEFGIDKGNYSLGDHVYYWLFTQDLYCNVKTFSSNFEIIDSYNPVILSDFASFSLGLNITGEMTDFDGSGIQKVEMAIGINTAPDWDNTSFVHTATKISQTNYTTLFHYSNLTPGIIQYAIRAYDWQDNFVVSYANFTVSVEMLQAAFAEDPANNNTSEDPGDSSDQGNTDNSGDESGDDPPGSNIGVIIGIIAAVAIGVVVILKKRSTIPNQTPNDKKNLDASWLNESKGESGWDTDEELYLPAKKQSKSNLQSNTQQTVETKQTESNETPPKTSLEKSPVSETTPGLITSAKSDSISGSVSAEMDEKAVFLRLTAEQQEIYTSAIEMVEDGMESMAVKSFEIILHQLEKSGDSELIKFIKNQMDGLY